MKSQPKDRFVSTVRRMKLCVVLVAYACLASALAGTASADPTATKTPYPTRGKLESNSPAFNKLVPPDAKIEVLVEGLTWCEGPVWVRTGEYLLFSENNLNRIYRWGEKDGLKLFMKPSGYTGVADYPPEPGSNGLTLDLQGRLICCEHGDRRVSLLSKGGGKITLADSYLGRRLNSPNDVVVKSNGDIYFTDPPYGLPLGDKDPRRELNICGVYRISQRQSPPLPADIASGPGTKGIRVVTLLTSDLGFPNGLTFSPDERTLYVSQSDPAKAIIMSYPVNNDGTLGKGKLFYDLTSRVKDDSPGLPDGMKVDVNGNVFCTGPVGVYVFSPEGELLGLINTGDSTGNCNWGGDGRTLYMAVNHQICRIRTNTLGAGW